MNQLITVNSYTMLASIIMITIATKLVVLITALLLVGPLGWEKAPASNGRGKLAERLDFRIRLIPLCTRKEPNAH
jgi:hypothetical protein